MPFSLPDGINNWLERRNAKSRAEKLMSTIADLNSSLLDREDGALVKIAREHLARAEERYQRALNGYKDDRVFDSHKESEFGLFRLELARQHLLSRDDGTFDPGFEEGSAEQKTYLVSQAIAETKMAIEYSNCAVTEVNRKNLVGVVTMFHDCLEMLKDDELDMCKRTAEGAILMLYMLEREIELDNRQTVVQLKSIPKFSAKESIKIKELVDKIAKAKQFFQDSANQPTSRVMRHMDEAVDNFYNAVQAYVDDDNAQIDNLTTTAKLQVEFAERLYKSSLSEGGSTPESEESNEERLKKQIEDFSSRLAKIKKLCKGRAKQTEFAEKRLDAAQNFYNQAVVALAKAEFAEAERLVRACHLDLDFARQLVFTPETAKYTDL